MASSQCPKARSSWALALCAMMLLGEIAKACLTASFARKRSSSRVIDMPANIRPVSDDANELSASTDRGSRGQSGKRGSSGRSERWVTRSGRGNDISCRAVTVGNRTERELGLPGHPDLAHQHDIESCIERACDLEADRDTSARQYQDDRLPVFQMQQLFGKPAPGLATICELHVRPPPSKPRAWPSDSLPQTSLFVQAIQFDTAEIETRNDSHDFVPIDDWDMSIAPVVHRSQRFDRRSARRHRRGIMCHDLSQLRSRRTFPFRKNAVNGITRGEDAQQAVIALGHEHGADAIIAR